MKLLLLSLCVAVASSAQIRIEHGEYHGWKDAVILRNSSAYVVVVPSVGRVMQFGLIAGNGSRIEGPFFNNRALDGKPVDPKSSDWINFGGDKSWPAPQSAWPQTTGRGWPPPAAFDSMADTVSFSDDNVTVVLTSAIDPHYGIRERRMILLDPAESRLRITTEYEKAQGAPVEVGVWMITQLDSPDEASAAFAAAPGSYTNLGDTAPYQLTSGHSQVTTHRDPAHSTKIGTNGDTLTWIGTAAGKRMRLTIERSNTNDGPKPRFPDNGCHVEIYTNPDPLPYIEMETLGPLRTMKVGDRIRATNVYTLSSLER